MRQFYIVPDKYREHLGVNIQIPRRSTTNSAAYDFFSPIDVVINPKESVLIFTDIYAKMYWDNVLMLFVRSSMGKHPIVIANGTGIIDADYAENPSNFGNIGFRLLNLGDTPYEIKIGDRIGQGIFIKYCTVKDDNVTTKREGGFGSSGQ